VVIYTAGCGPCAAISFIDTPKACGKVGHLLDSPVGLGFGSTGVIQKYNDVMHVAKLVYPTVMHKEAASKVNWMNYPMQIWWEYPAASNFESCIALVIRD
jgi:hypothetical protein